MYYFGYILFLSKLYCTKCTLSRNLSIEENEIFGIKMDFQNGFQRNLKNEKKDDHKLYAAKIIEIVNTFDGNDQMQIIRESMILSKLSHPAILKFVGLNFRSFEDWSILQPTIITEYLKNSSLKIILDSEKQNLADHNWTPTKKCIFNDVPPLKMSFAPRS